MSEKPHAIIAGAGIAGLTAAILLGRGGWRVTVLERAQTLEEAGAGLQLSPNATAIYRDAGILDRLLRFALSPEALSVRRARDGREIMNLQYGPLAELRWKAPHIAIHRADLQRVLLETASANPFVSLRTGVSVLGFASSASGVQAGAIAGGENLRIDGDILIGADGLHSAVREKLGLGEADRPVYSRRTAWRALLPAAEAPHHALALRTNLWLGANAHLVHYPLRGGDLVNIVAIIEDGWTGGETADFWQQNGDAKLIRLRFAGWHADARDLILSVREWKRWPLFDRSPAPRWSVERTVLIGDAAHPVLPFLAQGACLAVEDAAVLAKALAETNGNVNAAITQFERKRLVRAAEMRIASRRQGAIYHMSGPMALARDLVMSRIGRERLMSRLDWIYQYRV